VMDERVRRQWAATEEVALARGGISVVARATGMSRNTIRAVIRETVPTPDVGVVAGGWTCPPFDLPVVGKSHRFGRFKNLSFGCAVVLGGRDRTAGGWWCA